MATGISKAAWQQQYRPCNLHTEDVYQEFGQGLVDFLRTVIKEVISQKAGRRTSRSIVSDVDVDTAVQRVNEDARHCRNNNVELLRLVNNMDPIAIHRTLNLQRRLAAAANEDSSFNVQDE